MGYGGGGGYTGVRVAPVETLADVLRRLVERPEPVAGRFVVPDVAGAGERVQRTGARPRRTDRVQHLLVVDHVGRRRTLDDVQPDHRRAAGVRLDRVQSP